MPLVSEIGEFGLIERLRALDVVQGIGDDCAVLTPPPGHDLVVTTDAMIEGIHFEHAWMSWGDIGDKAAISNLSDIAAMGAQPAGLTVTLGLKADATESDIEMFYRGVANAVHSNPCPVVGGDIVASPKATVVSITAFGYVEHGRAARRSGALPGDEVWVTGGLGTAAGGLRLLMEGPGPLDPHSGLPKHFELRCQHSIRPNLTREGRAAVGTGFVHAMIDVSDGLAGDLGHVLDESHCGAVIYEEAIPIDGDLRAAAEEYGWDMTDLALHGGEDYQLLMILAPGTGELVKAAMETAALRRRFVCLGRIMEGFGITMVRRDGSSLSVEPKAFTHF